MGAERRVHITLTSRPGRHIVPLGPFFHELPQVFVGRLGQHHLQPHQLVALASHALALEPEHFARV